MKFLSLRYDLPKTQFQETLNEINDDVMEIFYAKLMTEAAKIANDTSRFSICRNSKEIKENITTIYELLNECTRTIDGVIEAQTERGELVNAD